MLQWAREIPIGGTPARSVEILGRNNDWLHASALPKLLLHARPGALVQEDTVDYLRNHLSNLEIVDVGEETHFIQEDVPATLGRAIAAWLAGVPEVSAP